MTKALTATLLLLMPLVLAGCLQIGGSLNEAQAACSASDASFLGSWRCIKGRVAAGQSGPMSNGPAIRYMATGDLLAERVSAHQITDAEARAQLAAELARGDAEFIQQQAQIAATAPIVCNHFGSTTVCN